jgi:hypothetical protein
VVAVALLAVGLTAVAGCATVWDLPDTTPRYVSFAGMIVAVVFGLVATRRGPAGVRAGCAVIAVIALMLGSTFFGLTYS